MQKKTTIVLGVVLVAGLGATAFVLLSPPGHQALAGTDPRLDAPLVRLTTAAPPTDSERSFTGTVGARVQSELGFRVPGKIVERFADVGQDVKAGQPLMRIDDADLSLALAAKTSAVASARAIVAQAEADDQRYHSLLEKGWVPRQRYEQAKAALDTAAAQLAAAEAAAEADARVAENAATYAILFADVDGTVVETLGEPGQVVAAGQTVVRIAEAGSREAVVALPETIRPKIGSVAEASIYGTANRSYTAQLRQLSDSADARTRTYEARYVLDGDAAATPLGSTVTIRISDIERQSDVVVPIGAVLDDGIRTGVWILDRSSSTVSFAPVQIRQLGGETATVTGITLGQEVVALGAHLLKDGASVRTEISAKATN